MKNQYKGLARILSAFKNSFDGLKYIFKAEAAFRQDLLFVVIFGVIAFLLPILNVERLFLISSLFLILFAEIVNSMVEAVVDRISSDWHKLSKAAKDMGSLLVFISFLYFIFVWFFVLKKFL